MTTEVLTPRDLISINIWSFTLGKVLVQAGVLQKTDIINEFQSVLATKIDPLVQGQINTMIQTVQGW